MNRVVIVGASLAGLHAARALRAGGFAGALTIVGAERWMPYDRPPLSKQLLTGEWAREQVMLSNITKSIDAQWELNARATALDLDSRVVVIGDGRNVPFDGLVIASGATPRGIAGSDIPGVHMLRTLDDALALESDLGHVRERVLVVGAGFIGAEVASSCRRRGLPVTMVESLAAPLSATLGPEVGEALAEMHLNEGVDLRLGVSVHRLLGDARVEGAELSDGATVQADVVVVAIGVVPAIDWLDGSGIPIEDGVMCDETCRVTPGVVAAGDVASWPNARFGEVRRVEHWDNAIRQGEHAGRRLLADSSGEPGEVYEPVPWVWSDQYDSKIQIVGSPASHDETCVVQRNDGRRRLVAVYRRDGKFVGAVAINRTRVVTQLRSMIAERAPWQKAVALARAAA